MNSRKYLHRQNLLKGLNKTCCSLQKNMISTCGIIQLETGKMKGNVTGDE